MKRWTWLLGLLVFGCGDEQKSLDRDALMNPEACMDCHPDHYREWSGSMHAYAAEDPVFLAMNARGQEETNGELGDFCVECHAPMAVREGLTTDGLNLDEVPDHLKGVTCYFCHNAVGTTDDHNAAVELANDDVLRGGLPDPFENEAHHAEYSPLHDRVNLESSKLCGSCHDIVTPKGVHLERTFLEWRETLFAHDTPKEKQTCSSCHMQGRRGVAAEVDGVPLRRVHDHRMVGVDVAITDFPEKASQRERIQRELDTTVILEICVDRVPNGVEVTLGLENFAAGHSWPSGAAQDRRAWVEMVAYRANTPVFSTGVITATQAVAEVDDPLLWRFGDDLFDENDQPVHMFWEAARVESNLLPGPTALPGEPEYRDPHVQRVYDIPDVPDRVEAKVHIRPMGREVLQDLVDSGHLDAQFVDRIPTFTLGASEVIWTAEAGARCLPDL